MAPDRGLAPMPGSYGPGVVVKHRSRRVVDWGVVSGAWMVMVRVVIGVLPVGRCGSALFQRDRGGFDLAEADAGAAGWQQRGEDCVADAAWSGGVVGDDAVGCGEGVDGGVQCGGEAGAVGSVSGTDSTAVTMALRRAWSSPADRT